MKSCNFLGAGGARRDPDRSQECGPWWSHGRGSADDFMGLSDNSGDQGGAGEMREPSRAGGLTGIGGDKGARSHWVAWSTGKGEVRDTEAGGGNK